MSSYPKWIYSAEGPRLIQSEQEHPGAGWFESPADIGKEEHKEPEKRKPGRPKKTEAE